MEDASISEVAIAGTSAEELAIEVQRLQAERLGLEIRELRLSWWKRPAWIAACATITAAVCGLIWATTTRYFDTRIRELRLETRDFEAKRDSQSQAFTRERRAYEQRLNVLRSDELRFVQRLKTLDHPIVASLGLAHAFWQMDVNDGRPKVLITGANFGDKPGQLTLNLNVRIPLGGGKVATLTPQIEQWTNDYVIARVEGLNPDTIQKVFSDLVRAKKADPAACMPILIPTIHRHDGLESRFWYKELPDLGRRLIR